MGSYGTYATAPTSYNLSGFLDDLEGINQVKDQDPAEISQSTSSMDWKDASSFDVANSWNNVSGSYVHQFGSFQGGSFVADISCPNASVSNFDSGEAAVAMAYSGFAGSAAPIVLNPPPPSSSETAPPLQTKFAFDPPQPWAPADSWNAEASLQPGHDNLNAVPQQEPAPSAFYGHDAYHGEHAFHGPVPGRHDFRRPAPRFSVLLRRRIICPPPPSPPPPQQQQQQQHTHTHMHMHTHTNTHTHTHTHTRTHTHTHVR